MKSVTEIRHVRRCCCLRPVVSGTVFGTQSNALQPRRPCRATQVQPAGDEQRSVPQHGTDKQHQAIALQQTKPVAAQAQDQHQKLQQQQSQRHDSTQSNGLQRGQQQRGRLYEVPWDIWTFIQVTAAVWVINQAIPYAVLTSAAHLQGVGLPGLPFVERELLNVVCQLGQLGSTYFIITSSISKHQPLPKPWYLVEGGIIPVLQGVATSIVGVGSGVLLSGFMTGHVDGAEEWRHLAGLHSDDVGTLALALGAVVLAPALEEGYFRGYVLPSLTKWTHPAVAVLLTGLLFASAHPADAFLPEALLGCVLSASLLAADGNLLVPLLAHSLYNTFVLGTEVLL